MYHFHGNAMSDFKNGFQRMNFDILSFQLIYNFWLFLKCDREKDNEEDFFFFDKGQNSCYDVVFWGCTLVIN